MKMFLGFLVVLFCIAALLALAKVGVKGVARDWREWRNPPPAQRIELPEMVLHSNGSSESFVPWRNEQEIEVADVIVRGTSASKDER
ncbi:hypothetical protein EPN90_01575 [Patescibacteria group bacterium]|nr:MAG: hypothetical protein EPN90_01575 [Patescibacteria group bacterium]